MILAILAKDGTQYWHLDVGNVRYSKHELRWTNSHGEKRQMALCFIDEVKMGNTKEEVGL